jgi:hypothetical protein
MRQDQKPTKAMNLADQVSGRKSYNKPSLTVYGDILAITRTVFNVSTTNDGGTGTMNKTH